MSDLLPGGRLSGELVFSRNNNVMGKGLAEGENVGLVRLDGECKVLSDRPGRSESGGDLLYE